MKKPYFLRITSVRDSTTDYPLETEPKLFTPSSKYFWAQKKPGETITVEVEVEDWDIDLYCSSPDVDIYCGESYGRA